ncbi:hypothetical protein [Spirillospora sp. CA-294931]|uniref:hypothetical protein n=1 Tax=Spirillospora sp. CA-294931 TaxID=3240042 RepID=UPI003D8A8EDC
MTDAFEDKIRLALSTRAETVRPHHHAYSDNRRMIRRAHVRRRMLVPAVAVATTGAVAAPFVLIDDLPGTGGNGPASGAAELEALMASPGAGTTVSGRLPGGGGPFLPEALGNDGRVLGRSSDSTVWGAGPSDGAPRSLGVRARGGLSAADGTMTWVEPGSWDLKCGEPGKPARSLFQSSEPSLPVLNSGGRRVWSDVMHQPLSGKGCDPGRSVPNRTKGTLGQIIAFSHPSLFLVEPRTERVVREVDVTTGRLIRTRPLPTGVKPYPEPPVQKSGSPGGPDFRLEPQPIDPKVERERRWSAAANQRVFAWVADRKLRTRDRRTGKETSVALPSSMVTPSKAARWEMTAGRHLIAYSAAGKRDGAGSSVVLDTRTKRIYTVPGPAYAAGDWLLWPAKGGYRLAEVKG